MLQGIQILLAHPRIFYQILIGGVTRDRNTDEPSSDEEQMIPGVKKNL